MFPLDDTRFYTKQEMKGAMLASVNFIHLFEPEIELFLDKHFARFTERNGDLIRGFNSGLLPRLYRPAETLFYAADSFGFTCLICRGGNVPRNCVPTHWLTDMPEAFVEGGEADDHGVSGEWRTGAVCDLCTKSFGRTYERITGEDFWPYKDRFASQEVFFATAHVALKTPYLRQRIRKNKNIQWRVNPLKKEMELA